jgi:hypothetical protein
MTEKEAEKQALNAKRYEWLRSIRRNHSVVGGVLDNTAKSHTIYEFALDRAIDNEMNGKTKA